MLQLAMTMAPPKIETERLLLTWPTRMQVEQYYSDIIGTNMFDTIQWDGPSGPEDLHSYWKECFSLDQSDINNDVNFAVIEKSSNLYLGGISLSPVDRNHEVADVGYAFAPKNHGKGFATEAMRALVHEAFAKRKAQRIFAEVFAGNDQSQRVAEKIGFKFEGISRRAIKKRGQWLDKSILAITRPDWEKLQVE